MVRVSFLKLIVLVMSLFAGECLHAAQDVQIGVLAFNGKEAASAQWAPTARHLSRTIPAYRFTVLPLDYDELNLAVKDRQVSFVLTNPEHYVVLRNVHRLSPMATVNTVVDGRILDHLGGVIFSRQTDKSIQALSNVKGKRVAAVGPYSLGGYLIAADLLHQQGIKLQSKDVQSLEFTGTPHAKVVEKVMAGAADVGIVRTGVLEGMHAQGQLDLANVKILNLQPSALYPQALSTRLYPEWPWAAMPGTDAGLAKAVALALLKLEESSPEAVAASISGFSPPANYAPVEELMRRMNTYPGVEKLPAWKEFWNEYETLIELLALVSLILFMLMSAYLWQSNRRLRELTKLYGKAQEGLEISAAAFDSQVGLIVTDEHTNILRVNSAFKDILGYEESDLLGKATLELRGQSVPVGTLRQLWHTLMSTGRWQGDLVCRHRSGHDLHCIVTITAISSDVTGRIGFVGSFVDVSKQKIAHAEIERLAFYDPLTDLPNRRLFMNQLTTELSGSVSKQHLGALLFIDLDHFKGLNDTHGHIVGDQLLRKIADRLRRIIGPHDMAARLGGDEFVVVLTQLNMDEARALAVGIAMGESVRACVQEPFSLNSEGEEDLDSQLLSYSCTASVGVSVFGLQHESISEVLKRADVAVYLAKQSGRDNVKQFDPREHQRLNDRHLLTIDLREAVAQDKLVVHYQLQVDSAGKPVGAECLLRWRHPVRGAVSPAEFIPLAEESGLIISIGEFVLLGACRTLTEWSKDDRFQGLSLSVNVSPRQFIDPHFENSLKNILRSTGARPDRLMLEITEGIVLSDAEYVIEKMRSLGLLGIRFSIDDFGTGYSSLSYLQRLPLSEVKIDKSFVNDMTFNPSSAAIVRSIILLGTNMNLDVVAEGVETITQNEMLVSMGCTRFQGYWISKPIELSAFTLAIEQWIQS